MARWVILVGQTCPRHSSDKRGRWIEPWLINGRWNDHFDGIGRFRTRLTYDGEGVIVVCGNHHHFDDSEMKYGQITDVPQEALDLAFSLGIEIPSGATVIVKSVDPPKDKLPILERGHNFAGNRYHCIWDR